MMMSSGMIEYLMDRPRLLAHLTKEQLEGLMELVRAERMRLRNTNAMPSSAVPACVSVVDDRLMSQIVADSRRSNSPGWLPPEKVDPEKVRGTGWAPLVPIGPDPNIKHIDAIAAHFDRLDREKR
jgi:hypothetical protein